MPSHEIQRLLPRHFRMLELRLAGMKNRQIAEILDCSEQCVYVVSRSPLFIAEFNRLSKEQNAKAIAEERDAFVGKAKALLNEAAEQAAQTQISLLESEDDSVKLRASGSILDRALGRSDDRSAAGTTVNVQINTQDAQLLSLALKEANQNASRQEPITDSSATSSSED